jgi:hypothetical protein
MAAPLGDTNGFITAFKDAGKNFSVLKSERAFVASRFQRVPVVAQCAFSGLPAEREEASVKGQPVSRVTRAKLEARGGNDLKKRMGDLFGGTYNPVINDEKGLDRLEDLDWIAVIHADGNGLGQVFTNLDKLIVNLVQENGRPAANGRDYVNGYRAFSNALDRISKSAFKKTVDEIFKEYKYASQKDKSVPVVPIVVGGDDLTVVMDGKKAIEFTKSYMVNFCEMTEKEDDISKILKRRAGGASRLGMCGEVCVTKPHFPFSASYRLAEELMKEAKKVKKIGSDCIAIDFHILYDSVATSIDDIREKFINEEEKEKVSRTAKPYVIDLRNHNDDAWKTVHSYGRFENAAKALATKKHDDATVRSLPSSQAHAIRDSLYSESITTQEAEWGYLVSKRDYKDFAEKWEEAMGSETLYLSANLGENAQKKFTYFLDALEAAEFLEGHGTLTIGGDNCE